MIELFQLRESYQAGDGTEYPRVTHVIRDLGLGWWSEDEPSMILGKAAHHGTRLLDEGRLDEDSLDDQVRPRVEAWARCKREVGFRVKSIERTVFNRAFGYAGTMDRELYLGRQRFIADFSIGPIPAEKGLQMVAYGVCVSPTNPLPRLGIELRDDGRYTITSFPISEWRADFRAFCGLLEIYQWRRRNHKISRVDFQFAELPSQKEEEANA